MQGEHLSEADVDHEALYDLNIESDKLALIQAVTLMGFWYTDPQDITGAWHWIGIAISLSQTVGIHRGQQDALRRRIWWCLVVRDRWLSLAKGRPMRICDDDCDVPPPTAEDVTLELHDLDDSPIAILPLRYDTLASMWVCFVNITCSLGRILKVHYGLNTNLPEHHIQEHAFQLSRCAPDHLFPYSKSDPLIALHQCQLELYHQ